MIVRVKKRSRFVVLDAAIVENDVTSWRAKGLLAYLLSKPDDWTVREADLVAKGTEGRDAVRAAIRELKEAGYMRTRSIPPHEGGGKELVVLEAPELLKTRRSAPTPENPSDGNPGDLTKKDSYLSVTNVAVALNAEGRGADDGGGVVRKSGRFWDDRDEESHGKRIRDGLKRYGSPGSAEFRMAWRMYAGRMPTPAVWMEVQDRLMRKEVSWDEIVAALVVCGQYRRTMTVDAVFGQIEKWEKWKSTRPSGKRKRPSGKVAKRVQAGDRLSEKMVDRMFMEVPALEVRHFQYVANDDAKPYRITEEGAKIWTEVTA